MYTSADNGDMFPHTSALNSIFEDETARRAGAKANLVLAPEELVAELVGEADLFARRDSGLQMMLPCPGSKEVSFALLPEHPGRLLVTLEKTRDMISAEVCGAAPQRCHVPAASAST
ncbi:hypothetical protein DV515_00004046, partial [Chloebia gouldiae]